MYNVFQMVIAMYLLWQYLGPAVLAGLGVLLLMVPANGFIYGKQQSLQVHILWILLVHSKYSVWTHIWYFTYFMQTTSTLMDIITSGDVIGIATLFGTL